jgi:hypothetical protein
MAADPAHVAEVDNQRAVARSITRGRVRMATRESRDVKAIFDGAQNSFRDVTCLVRIYNGRWDITKSRVES